ncbi:MAG: hypothetical protein DSY41_04095 [Candidatus Poseidoniales archaeon]|nr:MAG: hypothetical protein DSY41_04095 [Candidatus Poseidoniales archaeon]
MGEDPGTLSKLTALGLVPMGIVLSTVLFGMPADGQQRFAMAIFSLVVIMPLCAAFSLVLKLRHWGSEHGTRPKWMPRSRAWHLLAMLVLFAVLALMITSQGDVLGFHGMLGAWLVIWIAAYRLIN